LLLDDGYDESPMLGGKKHELTIILGMVAIVCIHGKCVVCLFYQYLMFEKCATKNQILLLVLLSAKENEIMRLMIHHMKCLIISLDVLGDDPMVLGLIRNADQQRKCMQGIHVCMYI